MDAVTLDAEAGAWDSVLLDPLTEESFIANLHQRFKRDHIYTYIGNMLVSINPYKKLPLYCKELVKAYKNRGPYQLPPHIFAVAGSAYRFLRDRNEDQVILLTGESGSGKTEAGKAVLTFLTLVAGSVPQQAELRLLRDRLVQSSVLLEAFGNAKTTRNENSSRFGNYVDVEFDFKGDPLGGRVTIYLLEKTRVTWQSANERNFHIFYQLLTGADVHLLKTLKLQRNIDKYAFLTGSARASARDDKRDFLVTKGAMDILGFSPDDTVNVLKIIAAVLKLGNIVFLPLSNIDGTEGCSLSNDYDLSDVQELLGCEALEACLTRRTARVRFATFPRCKENGMQQTPRRNASVVCHDTVQCLCVDCSSAKELYEVCDILDADASSVQCALTCRVIDSVDTVVADLTAGEASSARDALCKALYSRLFTYLVSKINDSIQVKRHGRRKLLGILDLYGFEVLERNGFDQLIINFCNEKLHQVITSVTLKEEQEEYMRENIDWVPIPYTHNQPICDLIENGKHGVLGLLDEETGKCGPRSDELFLSRLCGTCASHSHFEVRTSGQRGFHGDNNIPPNCFRVKHFLGPVTYHVAGFLDRNREGLRREVSQALHGAGHPLLSTLFPEGRPGRGPTKRPASTAAQFRLALCALVRTLAAKHPHYVRCLRPNEVQQPRVFESALVKHQVLCLGLLETVRVRRQGFCYRMEMAQFLNRYKMLSLSTWPRWCRGSAAEGVAYLLRDLPIPNGEFAFGRTKLFVRSPRTVFELEEFRRERLHDLAVCIQKTWRCHRCRTLFLQMRRSQIIIASAWRSWRECRIGIPYEGRRRLWCIYRVAREEYRILKRRRQVEWAVSVIQRYYIGWKRRLYLRRLSLALHKETESPICTDWPVFDRRLSETSALLRKIHHKWRCHKYRMQFDQTARNRMREKVTASIIFRDRKASYPRSVAHPFLGDYVRLRQNLQWKRMSADTTDQYVVFADIINKIARSSGKLVPVLFVLSTSSMMMLDQRTLQVKYRVPAAEMYRLSLSPYLDGVAVFHVRAPSPCSDSLPCSRDHSTAAGCLFQSDLSRKKGDFVFQTGHVIEIVTKLFLVVQNAVGKPPEVNISTEFEANFGQQSVTIMFKCLGLPEVPPGQIRILRKGTKMEILV